MDCSPQDQGAIGRIMVIRDTRLLKIVKYKVHVEKKSIKYVYACGTNY